MSLENSTDTARTSETQLRKITPRKDAVWRTERDTSRTHMIHGVLSRWRSRAKNALDWRGIGVIRVRNFIGCRNRCHTKGERKAIPGWTACPVQHMKITPMRVTMDPASQQSFRSSSPPMALARRHFCTTGSGKANFGTWKQPAAS